MAGFAAVLQCLAYILLFLSAAVSDHVSAKQESDVKAPAGSEKNTNPPANFISQLGNFILDVDEAVWKQTEPLRQLEERLVEQTFKGSIKPASEYISRIRENYRDLQKRIGNTLLNPIGTPASASGANSEENMKQSVDNMMPFLPERAPENSLNAKRKLQSGDYGYDETDKKSETLAEAENAIPKLSIPSFDGKFSVAGTVVRLHGKDSGASFHITQDQSSDRQAFHKRSGERDYDSDSSDNIGDFIASETNSDTFSQLYSDYEEHERPSSRLDEHFGSHSSKQQSSQIPEYEISFNMNPNMGRFAGENLADGLYSEMVMDKKLRQILRNHVVKFVLDPTLDPGKTIVRKLQTHGILSPKSNQSNKRRGTMNRRDDLMHSESEEFDIKRRFGIREQANHPDFIDEHDYDDQHSSTYFDMINIERMRKELHQVGLNFEDNEDHSYDSDPWSRSQNVILAFTPDGVPLRLGLDSEIENPLKYLRRSMYEAGVYLNIPVDARRLRPLGQDVLQLGATDDGAAISPLYVDLTDIRQEKALIKSLRRSIEHRYRPFYNEEEERMDSYY